jgi:hypothetical protein
VLVLVLMLVLVQGKVAPKQGMQERLLRVLLIHLATNPNTTSARSGEFIYGLSQYVMGCEREGQPSPAFGTPWLVLTPSAGTPGAHRTAVRSAASRNKIELLQAGQRRGEKGGMEGRRPHDPHTVA